MKAAVCESFGKPLQLKELPTPSPGPGDVLVRVKGCGVCHSDLHLVDGDWASWGTPLPIVPGHERGSTGTVSAAGAGATANGATSRETMAATRIIVRRYAPGAAAGEVWRATAPLE